MEDNAAFILIMEKGAIRHTRQIILRQGTAKFGEPTPAQHRKLNATEDLDRLDRRAERLLSVNDWAALLRGR